MVLYVDVETNLPDVYIDYIEATLVTGEEISLNWDESGIQRNENGFSARYKGVYFGEEYANGRISELFGMRITQIGIYTEQDDLSSSSFTITDMKFEDGENEYSPKHILPFCADLGGIDFTS